MAFPFLPRYGVLAEPPHLIENGSAFYVWLRLCRAVLNPFSRFVPAPAAGCSFVQVHEAKQFQLPPCPRTSSLRTLESNQTPRASIPSPSYRRSFDSCMKHPAHRARSEPKIGGER